MALISIKKLRIDLISDLLKSAESGMGYQKVVLSANGYAGFINNVVDRFIVNSQYVFDFENLNNLPLIFDPGEFIDHQTPEFTFDSITLSLNSRYDFSSAETLPPYTYYSKPGDVFIRLSGFDDDRRILKDGSVLKGTYATTLNDMKITPSGAAAVGRYALPDRVPACYVYRIIPPPGTPVFFGTVTPNYGLCGGGVEVFFPKGCPSGSAFLYETIPEM